MNYFAQIKSNYSKLNENEKKNVIFTGYGIIFGMVLFLIVLFIVINAVSLSNDGAGNISSSGDIAVYGERVYYCQSTGEIAVYDNKSKESKIIGDIQNCTNLLIWEKELYFIGGTVDRGIYRLDLQSGNTELLIKGIISELDVKDGTMIYISEDNRKIFQADYDGKFRRAVTENFADSFCFDGRYVYFTNSTGVFRYDTEERRETVISTELSGKFINEYKNKLFLYSPANNSIVCLSKDNKKSYVVVECEGECTYLNIHPQSGMMFYFDGDNLMGMNIEKNNSKAQTLKCNEKLFIYDGMAYCLNEKSVKIFDVEEIIG